MVGLPQKSRSEPWCGLSSVRYFFLGEMDRKYRPGLLVLSTFLISFLS